MNIILHPNIKERWINRLDIAASVAVYVILPILIFTGCKTSVPLMTPAALSAYVAVGAQIGVEAYPQAKPGVLLARDVICASAAQTNVNPAQIVADLGAAGITNNQAMIIVNGVVLIYETVISQVGTNASKAQPYLQAACTGLTEAFPPQSAVERVRGGRSPHQKPLPPHLRNQ